MVDKWEKVCYCGGITESVVILKGESVMDKKWKVDPAGVYHYLFSVPGRSVDVAAKDALDTRPKTRPAWFWFNGTPAPIYKNDTAEDLFDRWNKWRKAYQTDKKQFLDCLTENLPDL